MYSDAVTMAVGWVDLLHSFFMAETVESPEPAFHRTVIVGEPVSFHSQPVAG